MAERFDHAATPLTEFLCVVEAIADVAVGEQVYRMSWIILYSQQAA